jgi:hypothetical protein
MPAKVIIYSSSIDATKELSSVLDCHAYYRDVGDAQVKDEIREVRESPRYTSGSCHERVRIRD